MNQENPNPEVPISIDAITDPIIVGRIEELNNDREFEEYLDGYSTIFKEQFNSDTFHDALDRFDREDEDKKQSNIDLGDPDAGVPGEPLGDKTSTRITYKRSLALYYIAANYYKKYEGNNFENKSRMLTEREATPKEIVTGLSVTEGSDVVLNNLLTETSKQIYELIVKIDRDKLDTSSMMTSSN